MSPVVEENLLPCLYIFQFLGLMSFSIKNLKGKWSDWKFSLYFLVILCLVTTQSVASCYRAKDLISSDLSFNVIVNNVMELGVPIVGFVTGFCELLLLFISTGTQKKIFRNIFKIAQQFEFNLKHKIDYRVFRRSFLIKNYVIISEFLLIYGAGIVINLIMNPDHINYYGSIIPLLIFISVGCLLSFYAEITDFNLKNLDSVVESLSIKKLDSKWDDLIKYKYASRHNEEMLKRISEIKYQYLMIWETVQLINKCMGKPILIYVLLDVVILTFCGYYAFLGILSKEAQSGALGYLIVDAMLLLPIISVVHSCQKVIDSVSYSKALLGKT